MHLDSGCSVVLSLTRPREGATNDTSYGIYIRAGTDDRVLQPSIQAAYLAAHKNTARGFGGVVYLESEVLVTEKPFDEGVMRVLG